jgi:hypothetical protein
MRRQPERSTLFRSIVCPKCGETLQNVEPRIAHVEIDHLTLFQSVAD